MTPDLRSQWVLPLLALVLASNPARAGKRKRGPPPDPARCYEQSIRTLASSAFGGREPGTPGHEAAEAWIVGRMQAIGLESDTGYRQPFDVAMFTARAEGATLAWPGGAVPAGQVVEAPWSSSGEFRGNLAVGGTDQELEGRVLLVMPSQGGRSRLELAWEAREAGAVAVLFANEKAPSSWRRWYAVPRLGIPVMMLDPRATAQLEGLAGVHVSGQSRVGVVSGHGENLLGVLPGSGALADESVVIGAHYDHLGFGGLGSKGGGHALHPGADDNASGVALVLCAAEMFAHALPEGDRRALVVVAFDAEERGLLGSGWYSRHPVRPLESTYAMVNADMVGRLGDVGLQALGALSAEHWSLILRGALREQGLQYVSQAKGEGFGPSDHTAFFQRGIPVLHLFTGAGPTYHKPSDVPDSLRLDAGPDLVGFMTGLAGRLTTRTHELTWVPTAVSEGDSWSPASPILGVFTEQTRLGAEDRGALVTAVLEGSRGEAAGLVSGDVITGVGTHRVLASWELELGLREVSEGTVALAWRRGETVLRAEVSVSDP